MPLIGLVEECICFYNNHLTDELNFFKISSDRFLIFRFFFRNFENDF